MKVTTAIEPDAIALVEIIELKWLMAGEGLRVHVERLQADPAYANQTLTLAEASPPRRGAPSGGLAADQAADPADLIGREDGAWHCKGWADRLVI